jgi:hypothetical protein
LKLLYDESVKNPEGYSLWYQDFNMFLNMQRKDISIQTKKKLGKLLTHTGESEQRIEFSRQNLCKA